MIKSCSLLIGGTLEHMKGNDYEKGKSKRPAGTKGSLYTSPNTTLYSS